MSVSQACHGKKGSMKTGEGTNPVSHSEELLAAQMNLPGAPSEVSFQQVPRGTPGGLGPTDYVLVALLRFDQGILKHLAETSQPRPGSPPRISEIANRPWFPPSVKAAIEPAAAGTFSVRGRKFDASLLLKPPYATGYFVIVEGTDYMIVSAETS
jgi:hypothetical protein